MPQVRTRFAPSPTGYLHIGSLRTALFAYLIAKSLDGKLILRIEDTDIKRQVKGAGEKLIEILDWVGIKFDEGPHIGGKYGPYVQSQRLDIYKKYAAQLLDSGQAYRCFCSPERLQKMRASQQAKKLPPRYDRKCRDLDEKKIKEKLKNNEKFVIRQKMPLAGGVIVHDELRGDIKFKAEDLEDHILIKSDHRLGGTSGMPTYQFACPVDDYLMKITHVVRGEEWIPSFPKNVLLYQNFGWPLPKFVHLPLILNEKGGKLSKRQGDVAVEDFKAKGYLPEALINFGALLGWHPKDDRELFTLVELIKEFKIKDMGISPAVFDIEKLDYLNGYYIRQKSLDELVKLCMPYLEDNFKKTKKPRSRASSLQGRQENKETKYIKSVVALEQERLKKLSEIGELTEFFFVDKLDYEPNLLIWKKMSAQEVKHNLEKIYELLEKIPGKNWTNDSIEDAIISYLKAKELKIGEYLWPMRAALTGRKTSPGPFEVAEVLNKEETLKRVGKGIGKL
jgi:glutamyl-tRNA synthetase